MVDENRQPATRETLIARPPTVTGRKIAVRGKGVVRPGICGTDPEVQTADYHVRQRRQLAKRPVSLDYFTNSEIRLHLGDLDFDAFADLGPRDDDDIAPLNASDSITLLAQILDFDIAYFSGLDRWLRFIGGRFWRSLAGGGPTGDKCNAIGFAGFDRAGGDLPAWYLDYISVLHRIDFSAEQTQEFL